MVGFSVESTEEIKRLYKKKKAIDLGGTSEGDPNQRGHKIFCV